MERFACLNHGANSRCVVEPTLDAQLVGGLPAPNGQVLITSSHHLSSSLTKCFSSGIIPARSCAVAAES